MKLLGEEEWVDFGVLSCLLYTRHMVTMLYGVLVYSKEAKGEQKIH